MMEKTSKVVTITEAQKDGSYERIGTDFTYKREIVWLNVVVFVVLHTGALYGIMLIPKVKFLTILWAFFFGYASGLGITVGAHRLYAHKCFKATMPVRFVLICLQTIAGQNCMHEWVRDHRLHHKYSDTDADPHNINRGFFFSHVGWLLSRKHPLVKSKGKGLDMSDLEADKLVMFQKKYYVYLYFLMAVIFPVAVPVYFWNENLTYPYFSYLVRYGLVLNATWCVNSVAHMFGTRPFDKSLVPVESHFVSLITKGEGWHNYHHCFPWDYRASEFGAKSNVSARLIELLADFNLAYDLKTASREMVESRATKKGDGSHPVYGTGKGELATRNAFAESCAASKLQVLETKGARPHGMMEKTSKVVTITEAQKDGSYERIGTDFTYKREIVWLNVVVFVVLHTGALYGLTLMPKLKVLTIIWVTFVGYVSGLGITVGAHRLYAHKCFKATMPVRFVFICLQTIAGQNCMHEWVRDHRLHHKYSDTDADPHNINRGFFFSHVGWLLSRKHPLVKSKGKGLDMSDLEADKLVMFQKKYYVYLYFLMAVIFPVAVPVYFWNEDLVYSYLTYLVRYGVVLNGTWCVNSVAHMFGTRPFDKSLVPVESPFVSFITSGEGWHNYHHSFPWDYRASEFGSKFNGSARVIELLAYFNLVYDLKTTTREMVESRATKKGDGSHPVYGTGKGELATRSVFAENCAASKLQVCS